MRWFLKHLKGRLLFILSNKNYIYLLIYFNPIIFYNIFMLLLYFSIRSRNCHLKRILKLFKAEMRLKNIREKLWNISKVVIRIKVSCSNISFIILTCLLTSSFFWLKFSSIMTQIQEIHGVLFVSMVNMKYRYYFF